MLSHIASKMYHFDYVTLYIQCVISADLVTIIEPTMVRKCWNKSIDSQIIYANHVVQLWFRTVLVLNVLLSPEYLQHSHLWANLLS